MIRVLLAIDSLIKGGTERRMLELVKELSRKRDEFDIYLISLTDCVEYEYVYQLPIKFEVLRRKSKKDLSLISRLNNCIRTFQPHIIHSWGSMASVFLAPLAKINKVRFINGFIGRAPLGLSYKDTHYLRGKLTYPFSDVVISNSKAGIQAYRAPIKKSVCIYNGMDFTRFQNLKNPSEVRRDLFGDDEERPFVIAMVAAFQPRKDHQTFIDVAIEMSKRYSNLRFLLIGGGDSFGYYKSMVPNRLINKNIFFLGKRIDVESILQIIDVGVLLTNSRIHGEGVANSIIEYMALRKPVIATRGGGTDEVVFDNSNGFLVDYADKDRIIVCIEKLMKDPELAKQLGDTGYNFVRKEFDSVSMASKYITIYKDLLKQK